LISYNTFPLSNLSDRGVLKVLEPRRDGAAWEK
jgi:hypothetical protein